MTPNRYQRVRDLYHAACGLIGDERNVLLERECAGDAELLAEVRSLLAHHDDDEGTLSDADLGLGRRLFQKDYSGSVDEGGCPERIGRYRILRRIGEGGMGVVFEAEQENPHRRVAVKLIRHGFSSENLVRRFRHEAEILGRLRHAGIAHIYEAGVHTGPTGARTPFLAMELIQGLPLLEYVQRQELDTRQRLALFAKVCDGVAHAHQNGVIHRDLKPGNILVVDQDVSASHLSRLDSTARVGSTRGSEPAAQPKILDFGIARAIGGDIQLTTLRTSTGQLLGTVPYMSPEQTSGDSTLLDTRTDVYSLGVILYELLVGRLPYELQNRSIVEAVRVIQECEPTRIGAIDRTCRGDIDTLLAKALEKDPALRYSSAAELAADIRRYLADLPLIARPASSLYQLRKFARRNRLLVGATLVCFILLTVGVIGTSAGLVTARRANRNLEKAIVEAQTQRDLARESEAKATTQLTRSRQVVGFLRWMLRSADPSIAKGRDVTLFRELLENTIKRLDGGELKEQPAVEAELRAIVAETYSSLGDNAVALRVIEPAIALARAAPSSMAGDYQSVRILYASILGLWGRNAEARDVFEECVQAINSGTVKEDADAALLYSNYANVVSSLGDADKALELHRMALDTRRRLHGEENLNVVASMGNIAGTLKDLKRYDEAYPLMKDVLERYRAADPPRLLHVTIAETMMADLLLAMGKADEAEFHIREALVTGLKVLQPEHHQIGECYATLGLILRAQDRHEEARESFARAVEIFSHAFKDEHPSVFAARLNLGIELARLGRFVDAEHALLAACNVRQGIDENAKERTECSIAAVELYETWHQADPNGRHDRQASEWAAKIGSARPTMAAPTESQLK